MSFLGFRREGPMQYMFLEYAVGGELFDRIEPDRGMSVYQAKKYFRELISGVVSDLYVFVYYEIISYNRSIYY